MSFRELTLVGAMALALAACGGGGGGGGGGGDNGGGGGGEAPPAPNVNPAEAYDGERGDNPFTEAAVQPLMHLLFENQFEGLPDFSRNSKAAVNEQLACDSGSASISGQLDDVTLLGSLIVEFDSCYIEGIIQNGSFHVELKALDVYLEPLDYKVTYDNWRQTYQDGYYEEVTGTIEVIASTAPTITEVANVSVTGSFKADAVYFKNFVAVRTSDQPDQEDPHNDTSVTISGQIYTGTQGLINVTTDETLRVGDGPVEGMSFAEILGGGVLRLHNSNSSVVISARTENPQNPTYTNKYVTVEADYDADGQLDFSADTQSNYLFSPILSDLSDDDNDGMHDGWERYYGMNPNLDDGMEDLDGDSVANLFEFLAGYIPSGWDTSAAQLVVYSGINTWGEPFGAGANVAPGGSVSFDLGLYGRVSLKMAEAFPFVSFRFPLGDIGDWTVTSSAGCFIESGDQPTLVCEQIPISELAVYTQPSFNFRSEQIGSPFATLTLSNARLGYFSSTPEFTADYPVSPPGQPMGISIIVE